ncbi:MULTISPECIES: NUDIX domain-containing protein [Glycomyces]|uniref:8-oxo-dGTP pyrophosphatase MutT (NUDIX family) n=2 Tax=Glycomyces TaxID=58113 RepID=A0A9X3SXE9_9ACTN|nr:NUDIX hydrolase [Glycomyces lechevalierae]MDA1385036.1 NUDIX hydrolase [Glycomyces lechevalierae]MDR7337513.1 8-oxo-dGTP pyrophosphatase MutT (NUDIX family) [Glycomyces lechevalierae]
MTDASNLSRIDRIAVSGTAAAAFITDPAGRVLLVKPTSRDEWGFTGGWVDRGETPHEGCAREIKEEIGLDLAIGDLLVLDWITDLGYLGEPLSFYVFDAGVVADPTLARPRPGEIEALGFFAPEEALARCGEFNRARLGLALKARRTGKTVYQPFSQAG